MEDLGVFTRSVFWHIWAKTLPLLPLGNCCRSTEKKFEGEKARRERGPSAQICAVARFRLTQLRSRGTTEEDEAE